MSLLHPAETDTNALDSLAKAHTSTIDALAGFETMVEKAEPEFRPVAIRFRDLHRSHAEIMAGMLRAHGQNPDDDGSFMGLLDKVVVSLRAWFGKVDADALEQIRSGEQHVLDDYREAEAKAMSESDRSALTRMRRELEALVESSGRHG